MAAKGVRPHLDNLKAKVNGKLWKIKNDGFGSLGGGEYPLFSCSYAHSLSIDQGVRARETLPT